MDTALAPQKEEDSGDHPWRKTWGVPWIEDWDNPDKNKLPVQSSRLKRQIILVRHGQYKNEGSGNPDSSRVLTELGRQQALQTGKYLAKFLQNSELCPARDLNNVYVSTLTRARQTYDLILEGMGDSKPKNHARITQYDDLLREIFPCDPSPPYPKKCKQEDEITIEKAYMKYIHRPKGSAPSVDLFVGHGNVTRYFVCRALQLPPEAWLRISLPHCSITSLTVNGKGRVSIQQLGSVGHLPVEEHSISNVK